MNVRVDAEYRECIEQQNGVSFFTEGLFSYQQRYYFKLRIQQYVHS